MEGIVLANRTRENGCMLAKGSFSYERYLRKANEKVPKDISRSQAISMQEY